MLQVYNTLTREKETFHPLLPQQVGLYACGVTVYDYCHLGHARVYTCVDIVIRYLRARGYNVNYVRNITDIDDKIIKRANEQGVSCETLTQQFTQAMHEDFAALQLLLPDHEPRATAYIPQMVQVIERLIAKEHAYVSANGDVYFNVRCFKTYGCLSHHDMESLTSGVRVEINEAKRDPLDFVLWKKAKPNEPSWDSPWGAGRPGWHIECSAMSMDILGEQFDMHMGGRDLIFPHHENEIAQSEAATNKRFVNYWLHAGFLQIDKEKMSKSLNNFVTIRDILKDHEPEVLRYFLMASHYRSPLIYTPESLPQAKQALTRFYTALRHLEGGTAPKDTTYATRFMAAMDDDFNTPVALAVLFDLAHEIQRLRETDEASAKNHAALLKEFGATLGILQQDPESFFKASATVDADKVESLIAARHAARAAKDWALADKIRGELAAMSVVIEDRAGNTTWRVE